MKSLDKDVFSKLEYEVVAYDEIERFNDYESPEFDYPYAQRKNQLSTINFKGEYFGMNGAYNRINFADFDYEYTQTRVKFQISKICLEENYLDSVKKIIPDMWQTF